MSMISYLAKKIPHNIFYIVYLYVSLICLIIVIFI